MIQSANVTSATFEAFAEAYLCFLVSATANKRKINNNNNNKKNAEAIKFLGVLKKYVSKKKNIFSFKKEKQCFA